MTTPHVHQATINAWAAGAQIQWRINDRDVWEDTEQPVWYLNHQYRVKNPHQDLVDAHEAGEIIEVDHGAYWTVVFEPEWQPGSTYRISPRSAELKPMVEAHKAGKQIQRKSSSGWHDTLPTWSSIFEYRIKDKFADLKNAFSEGKLIESFNTSLGQFCVVLRPLWDERVEHRLCPRQDELKPVIEAHLKGKQIEFNQRSRPGWCECVVSPLWQASHDYRIKPRWPKELDAYLKGEVIQSGGSGVWYDQHRSPELEQELRDGRIGMKVRIKPAHKHQAVIDAYEAGQTAQCRLLDGTWYDHKKADRRGPPCFSEDWEYRIKQPHQEVRDAFAEGKAVQFRVTAAEPWEAAGNPRWYSDWQYRVKPESLKSRRYIYNPAGKQQVGICDPNNHHQVPASTFVRWIDDDWVETEV